MFGRNKTPKTKDIKFVNPYYLKYDGKKGYAQVMGGITHKYIAIVVNSPTGKIKKIMKVTKREHFSDFGGGCTSLNFEATGFVLKS